MTKYVKLNNALSFVGISIFYGEPGDLEIISHQLEYDTHVANLSDGTSIPLKEDKLYWHNNTWAIKNAQGFKEEVFVEYRDNPISYSELEELIKTYQSRKNSFPDFPKNDQKKNFVEELKSEAFLLFWKLLENKVNNKTTFVVEGEKIYEPMKIQIIDLDKTTFVKGVAKDTITGDLYNIIFCGYANINKISAVLYNNSKLQNGTSIVELSYES